MKLVVTLCVFLLGYAGLALAFGTGEQGCGGDCTGCHKVSIQDAQDAVRKLDPLMNVEKIGPSPVPGLYQMVLSKENNPAKMIAYLDFSKRYLIKGTVMDTGNLVDLTRKSTREMLESQVVDVSRIKLDNALLLGNPQGSRRLYLYSDPECPYCAKLHEQLRQLVKKLPDLTVYILLLPLDIHPDSAWKTNSILTASKTDMGRALALLEESYNRKPVERIASTKDYAAEMKSLGKELGITSTPTLVYANGNIALGSKTAEEIEAGILKNPKP